MNTQIKPLSVSILDNQRTSLIVLDAELHVRYLNPMAESLLLRSDEQSDGFPITELLPEEDHAIDLLRRALEEQHSITARQLNLHIDQQPVLVDLTATPLLNEQTDEQTLLVEIHPLEQQLRMSRDDQLARQQETSRRLTQGLAHEIKNPLGGIRGATQLLEKELTDESLTEYTSVIRSEVDRLTELVDRLLGPRQAPQFTVANVHEITEGVVRILQPEFPDCYFRRDYDPSLPPLELDRDRLFEAVLNVARNACEAMGNTEQPCVEIRTRIARQVTLAGRALRTAVQIDIEDNGPGVAEEMVERMFFPMISGRARGTGLGLAMAQSAVVLHHGTLEYRDGKEGAVFTFLLPLNQPT